MRKRGVRGERVRQFGARGMQRLWNGHQHRVVLFVAGFAVMAAIALIATKAATPNLSVESDSGICTGNVGSITDTSASGGKAVRFGSASGCVASVGPGAPGVMTLISRGKPAYASSGTASGANDNDYFSNWRSSGTVSTASPQWVTYDLSSVPAAQRQKILAVWWGGGGEYLSPHYNGIADFTIDVSMAPGGTSPPAVGATSWTTLKSVTANNLHSRQYIDLNMAGANWIRIKATASDGSTQNLDVSANMFDIYDSSAMAGQAPDDFMIYGDSITANERENIADIASIVHSSDATRWPVFENGGHSFDTSLDGINRILGSDGYMSFFPGRYVILAYGMNDAGGGQTTTQYYNNMLQLSQAIQAAGKVPIIPLISWGGDSQHGPNIPSYNAKIKQLFNDCHTNPSLNCDKLLLGPDMYSWYQAHQSEIEGNGTGIHPSGQGIDSWQYLWGCSLLKNVYHVSTMPSSCSTYSNYLGGALAIKVSGNKLVDASGAVVKLHGVNRMGGEYDCVQNKPLFDSKPIDAASVTAMKSWGVNAVRITANEDCWLGINGQPNNGTTAAQYQQGMLNYVQTLTSNGMYVVFDLHWSAPGTFVSNSQSYGPDNDHSITFWQQVATALKGNPGVIFDLYNEPLQNYVTADASSAWNCWLNGCTVTKYMTATNTGVTVPAYQLTGLNQLISAIRGTGAVNPVLANGIDWANDVSQWLSHKPTDSLNQIIVGAHEYPGQCDGNNNTCNNGDANLARRTGNWDTYFGNPNTPGTLSNQYPVLIGEIGDRTGSALVSGTDFLPTFLQYAESRGWSYFAWAWFSNQDPDNILLMQTSTYQGGNGDYLNPTPTLGEGATYKNWLLTHPVQ